MNIASVNTESNDVFRTINSVNNNCEEQIYLDFNFEDPNLAELAVNSFGVEKISHDKQ